jgi:hypothetical protein
MPAGENHPAGAATVRLLAVNVGSSSLKLTLLAGGEVGVATALDRWPGSGQLAPLADFIRQHGPVDAVAHRVVHGGPCHTGPALVDAPLIAYLDSITHLAPLHQPQAVVGILAVRDLLPGIPAVACSTRPFTRRCRQRPGRTPFHRTGTTSGSCAGKASTASPTHTPSVAPPSWSVGRSRTCASSPVTPGRALHWPRFSAGRPWTPPWGSHR